MLTLAHAAPRFEQDEFKDKYLAVLKDIVFLSSCIFIGQRKSSNLGLDIDGVLDCENQAGRDFFATLSVLWPGRVIIVTCRPDLEGTQRYLASLRIRYDEVILANQFKDKAKIIKEKDIKVFVDDMDEVITDIPDDVTVLKIRDAANFCFKDKKWIYSRHTGRELNDF